MNLTYGQIAEKISKLTVEELNQTATVYVKDADEYYPISSMKATGDVCNVLDEGHIIFIA
jgi:hypothetical protein